MIITHFLSEDNCMSKDKKIEKQEKKIKNVSDLLDTLSNTEDKKELLWKDAYQNAIEDREAANILASDLLLQITKSLTNHQSYGSIMSKYLERMSKSNDQILKLAELISKEQETETISNDDIFKKIGE